MPFSSSPSSPSLAPRHWGQGLTSALSVAALVTWLSVLLQVVDREGLLGGDPRQWLGLLCLLAVPALFVVRTFFEHRGQPGERLAGVLVLLQGAATLAASWLLQSSYVAIVLVIVAAQLVGFFSIGLTVIWLLAFNACIAWIWAQDQEWPRLGLVLLSVMSFQAFALLTGHYAVAAERTRDELARVNAQLLATQLLLEESARGEERLKLSRELHDVAGHKLTALKLNLGRLARDPAVAGREEIAISTGLAHELLNDIRAVVGELRKHDGVDLGAALEALTRQIPGPRFHIEITVDARVEAVQAAETLLRCAQEGITNALRHGHPSEIRISCVRHQGQIELRVSDNGAAHPRIAFGNGLTGMRERLEALGGTLRVAPVQGRGVELIASLPVNA